MGVQPAPAHPAPDSSPLAQQWLSIISDAIDWATKLDARIEERLRQQKVPISRRIALQEIRSDLIRRISFAQTVPCVEELLARLIALYTEQQESTAPD